MGRKKTARAGRAGPRGAVGPGRRPTAPSEVSRLRDRVVELEAAERARTQAEEALHASDGGAAEALRRSEARAMALLEAVSEAIVIVAPDGRIASVNAKTEELFGYPRGELVGQRVEMLLPERVRAGHPQHRAKYLARPVARPMGRGLDLAGRRKDGREFSVEISLSHMQTTEGPQTLALITDITQRLAVDQATRQAERLAALGRLSAGIAHEINNPIGIITSRIEVMLLEAGEHALPLAVVEDLQVLHRNAMRVARIAQTFLSFARQSPAERAPVDLNRVVRETLELVERQIGKDGVRITTRLEATLPRLLGHANALSQVLLNLITNARDALPGEGEIVIESSLRAGDPAHVALRVSDTGPGIAPEALSRIFDPFYTTKPSGTGLGLSVSYGIVRDHNGTIDVQSTPGKGTTFILTFPALHDSAP
ncbi:MAG TPA: ATP-binding protein [Candidatus Limnocylindrales bacterium]|nr:ATP-binding protein [Candidatus Limnocylindrales bacterium]